MREQEKEAGAGVGVTIGFREVRVKKCRVRREE